MPLEIGLGYGVSEVLDQIILAGLSEDHPVGVWRSAMASGLSIDPELLEEALRLSGEKTKTAAVTKALLEFVARRRQKDLLDLFGRLSWDSAFDYPAERPRT